MHNSQNKQILASWPASGTMIARLIGEAIYSIEHDSTIKAAQRNGKPPDEFICTGSLGERVEQIEETIKAAHFFNTLSPLFARCFIPEPPCPTHTQTPTAMQQHARAHFRAHLPRRRRKNETKRRGPKRTTMMQTVMVMMLMKRRACTRKKRLLLPTRWLSRMS